MVDEQIAETGQFSFSGQKYQPEEGFVSYFEPGQLDQLEANGRLHVVADGIGGAASGAIASQYAVKKVLHDYYRATEQDLEKRLMTVIRRVNTEIVERNSRFPERRPMAATLLAALIHDNKLWVANVGDGRVYVVWNRDIEQLTPGSDLDKPSSAGPRPAPFRAEESAGGPNPLTRLGLGLNDQIKIDVLARKLFPGDTVVLCSGGLAGYVSDEEIARTIGRYPPAQASRQLAELAGRRGSRDTTSVSVTRLLDKPVTQAALRPKPLPAPPDWDQLAKPVVKSQPIGTHRTATQILGSSAGGRRGRWLLPMVLLVLLLVGAGLGVAGAWLWRTWVAPETAVVGIPEAYQGPDGDSATLAGGAATTPAGSNGTPGTGVAESPPVVQPGSPLSPLATPQTTPAASTGRSAAGETITSTVSPGRNSAQTEPALAAGPSPTPLPTIALPADCIDRARFAGDVTVPDGQTFAPGEPFDKSWLAANYGTCPWGPGYTVRFVSGDRMAGETQTVTEVTEPEGMGAITVPMVAPEASGVYQGTWQLYSLAGEPFGPELYVEIEVAPDAFRPEAAAELNTLYDFVENAGQATWTAGDVTYTVERATINRDLVIPFPEGIVAVGPAEFGDDYSVEGDVLLTHPHQEFGYIEGVYTVETPLQPTDAVVAWLGFPRAAVINDDGVTFKLVFRPANGLEQTIFSRTVTYEDGPVAFQEPLAGISPGQSGVFALRVNGGDSLSYDWATWITVRLVRP